ncbi:hypothetical protein EU545_02630, partial [Candidatus Thorarchaeota archaeon]
RGGVSVPRGFSISGDFYEVFIGDSRIQPLIRRLEQEEDLEEIMRCANEIASSVEEYDLPEELKTCIGDAKNTLEEKYETGRLGYAVRSSATIEDGKSFSFAGQAESCLCVMNKDKLIDSVKRVWQSTLTPRALLYLQSKKVPLSQVRMSVMIQDMVPADAAGVLFTTNVATSDTSQILIEAVRGLGEPLVSGRVTPDTYIVDRESSELLEQHLGEMESMLQAGPEGARLVEVPNHLRGIPVLDEDTIGAIGREGVRIESLMGCPQDIEWSLQKDSIVVLQSRPITTM